MQAFSPYMCIPNILFLRDVFEDATVEAKAKSRSYGSRPRTPMKSYMISEAP